VPHSALAAPGAGARRTGVGDGAATTRARGGLRGVDFGIAGIMFPLILFAALAAAQPPGSFFNLTTFGLQLPLSNGKGGVTQILQPALNSYSSAYFYTDPKDQSMAFWCPENGATTSGSSFPRSELREEIDFDLSAGRHVINATVAVAAANSTTASVTIGQAHVDGISGHCSIFVELMWTSGTVIAHLRDKACNNVNRAVGKYALGEWISYAIIVDGNTAQILTDKDDTMTPYAYTWLKESTQGASPLCPRRGGVASAFHSLTPTTGTTTSAVYFKAGNYLQSTGSSGSRGSIVKIKALSTSHAG